MLSYMFWNKHMCAFSVTLPEQTKPKQTDESFSYSGSDSLFDAPDSYPHLSLAKHREGYQTHNTHLHICMTLVTSQTAQTYRKSQRLCEPKANMMLV